MEFASKRMSWYPDSDRSCVRISRLPPTFQNSVRMKHGESADLENMESPPPRTTNSSNPSVSILSQRALLQLSYISRWSISKISVKRSNGTVSICTECPSSSHEWLL